MFDLCKAFAYLPPLQGRRVGIVTNSGGPGVLAADRAEEVGLDVAEPSPELKRTLSGFLPAHCALKNPIDLTVEGTEDGYRQTLLAVLQEYDVALSLNIATPYIDSVPLARGICDAASQSAKPIVAAFLPAQIVSEGVAHLQERSIPNFATGERAVAALARMADSQEIQDQSQGLGFGSHELEATGQGSEPLPELPGEGPMLEPEAMTWLRENSIPVPEFRFASTPTQVAQGCQDIGYPVAIKLVSPDILHKSDVGGVVLGVQDERAALAAFETLQASTRAASKDFQGVVIYPMIQGAQEVLLGLSRDPQFGPVVAIGLGGIYTEIWRDVSLRIAPVNRVEADSMIQEIRAIHLLEGVRGQPPCDLETLADVLVRVSWLPFRYPEINEVDLNPVFLFSEGLLVGDVRVIRRA
jgi:acyl-CoA synthetase (NDP forming)